MNPLLQISPYDADEGGLIGRDPRDVISPGAHLLPRAQLAGPPGSAPFPTPRTAPMPATPYLVGNCDRCPACNLQQEAPRFPPKIDCQVCDGSGLLPRTDAEIVRRTIAWAREFYWKDK